MSTNGMTMEENTMKLRLARRASAQTHLRFAYKNGRDLPRDFTGDRRETTVRYDGGRTVIWCGLGDEKECRPHILRTAAALGIRKAAELKRAHVAAELDRPAEEALAAAEGLLLGSYAYDRYLSEKPFKPGRCDIVTRSLTSAQLNHVEAACGGVFLARDLTNENAEVATPEHLARAARALAKGRGTSVTVLDERALKKLGLNLLLAVGRGSPTPPRLICIDYRGNPASRACTAIVGKGITFDSGGLNLKPSGSIETMRQDMAGAAAVLGTMQALTAIRPKINVTGVCACAHNSIDGASYLPGDVIRSYSGKTVEICNTDAEGRLALADAIAYAVKRYKPAEVIDLATLTGGILTTFADVIAGLFSNDDGLAARLFEAGEQTHERLWRLPIYGEYSDAMKGDYSDIRSLAKFKRGHASSITGAAFIREFAGDVPWAHLDIAGTAFNENEAKGDVPRYATGFGVRLLLEYLMSRRAGRRPKR